MSADSNRAVFLSYASQDTAAVLRLCSALRTAGIEVWFDQNELGGGDGWDRKIRGQIKECALFMPVISAATQARLEGYFRLEWKLAAQRTHTMADAKPFLVPVVIDDTRDAEAHVPEEFRAVQWTRLPGGEAAEKFCARVQVLLGSAAADVGPVADRAPGQRPGLQPKVGRRVPAPAWIAAATIVAVGALYFALRPAQDAGAGTRPPTTENAVQKSVAVLAFKNLSGDPAREFFSDGLSEAVTDVLGRVPGLKVVGSASAFSFKGKPTSIPEIARQLGVTHLVEGTVVQDGQMVRITAKLITADGFQVWVSDKLDRELKNIFALHDEVAGLIAKNLSLRLGASSPTATTAVNPQAFELYVQARQAWNRRTPEGFDQAEPLLTRALVLEPNFARAHAALADVWAQRLFRARDANGVEARINVAEGVRIQERIALALALDPDSAEAHASLGIVLYRDGKNAAAASSLGRAVGLNPNYPSAQQWLGQVLLNHAQMDQALEHLKLATELDPLSPISWAAYGFGLQLAGRFTAGIAACDRALSLRPNFEHALRVKSNALVEVGRFAESIASVAQLPGAHALNADVRLFALARAGRTAEAEGLLAQLTSQASISHARSRSLLALRRTEEALDVLRQDRLNLYRAVDYLWDPVFDPLRNDPRWVKFIAESGLTEAHARAQAWRKAHPPEKPAK